MKTTRIVLASIFISILLLPYQIGKIQAYDQSSDLNVSAPLDRPDLLKTAKPLSLSSDSKSAAPEIAAQTGSCHFGIAVIPPLPANYDLSMLGVESYLDWGYKNKVSTVADNIQYYRVLWVNDTYYASYLRGLKSSLSKNLGSVWIIGNEPDAEPWYQDHVSAESYADRFWEMASFIRANDPTAKIAFGTVIMPTPVRLHYLGLVINRLTQLAGSRAAALSLIDIYSIHSFLLNEHPIRDQNGTVLSWGAGVPTGYDPKSWPAYQEIVASQTYDINIFKTRVTAYRQWMKDLGEQTKPLWITEYGSLLPTWLDVSDLTTATYMVQTFDFMLGTKDPVLGNINDENRLVQKFIWYSLNDIIEHYGGSIFNPLTHQMTLVGQQFMNYNPPISAVQVKRPDAYIDASNPTVVPGPFETYKFSFKVSNNVSSDRLTNVRVDLLLGNTVIGSINTNLPRCAGKIPVSFIVNNLNAGESYTFTARISPLSPGETDINPSNNVMVFQPITMPASLDKNILLPLLFR